MSTYLGIDVGTSGVKAILIDDAGKPLGEASAAAVEPVRPQPGWSEQNPADWWSATLSAIDKLAADHKADVAAVKGIGLSGHMHGATLLGKDNEVLRPAILWNDGRSHVECGEMEARPALAAPARRQHRDAGVHRTEDRLGAEARARNLRQDRNGPPAQGLCAPAADRRGIEDMSDASGTLWLDVAKRDWSDDLLALTGFTRPNMPKLAEGTDPAGHLKDDLKARWGMTGTVVVAGSAGDNAAAACGIGAIRPGEGFVSLGTSGVLFVSNDKFRPNTEGAVHAFCHSIPNTWHQMGVILSATDSLNWLAHVTGQKQAELSGKAEAQFKGPGEEIFLPYLSGERTPHNNANARGSFVGLSHLSGPERLAQAVMEGVAFAFRDCQRVLSDAGTKIDRLLAVGGGIEIEPLAQDDRHQPQPGAVAPRGWRFRRRARRGPPWTLRRRPAPSPARRDHDARHQIRPSRRILRSSRPTTTSTRATAHSIQPSRRPVSDRFLQGYQTRQVQGPAFARTLLAYRHYNKDELVMGKRMEDHIRPAIAYWHTFAWEGGDPFGGRTFDRPWYDKGMEGAKIKADVAFELFDILERRSSASTMPTSRPRAKRSRRATRTSVPSPTSSPRRCRR